MDTLVLQKALRKCAERATKLDVYVAHHALNFAQALEPVPNTLNEGTLCQLIGIEFIAKSLRCESFITHPSHEAVRLHIRWLLRNLPGRDKPGKRSRWAGFAAGAASRIRLRKDYYCKDIADPGDIEQFIALAYTPTSSRHYRAHLALGYLQGWLWAAGEGSIDDYRRMNMPQAPALAS